MQAGFLLTLFACLAAGCPWALAADILFTNRIATFTNLQGQLYRNVQLVLADQDGLIWRDGASGGRVCYTNLHPDLLRCFGISSNHIQIAKARAEAKAAADARYRAMVIPDPEFPLQAQAGATNALPAAPASPGSIGGYGANPGYAPGSPSPFPFMYGSPFDAGVGSAASAASAPSAAATAGAATAPGAGSTYAAETAPRVPFVSGSVPALSSSRAPSAPSASFPRPPSGTRR